MYIVRKENPKGGGVGVCENCECKAPGRRVEAVDFITRQGRGWYNLCYKCFGPRVFWRKSAKSSQIFESPASI